MQSLGRLFAERFGEEDVINIQKAAISHSLDNGTASDSLRLIFNSFVNGNPNHDKTGEDPFAWAIMICIGYDCMSRFREYHGIKAEWEELLDWCKVNKETLLANDGDRDPISNAMGLYEDLLNG